MHKRIFSALSFLDRLKDVDIFFQNPKLKYIDQKWHLYVAVFGYSLVCQRYRENSRGSYNASADWNWKSPKSFWDNEIMVVKHIPLKVWMIENAEEKFGKMESGPTDKISEAFKSRDKAACKRLIDRCFNSIFYGDVLDDDLNLELSCKKIHDEMLK